LNKIFKRLFNKSIDLYKTKNKYPTKQLFSIFMPEMPLSLPAFQGLKNCTIVSDRVFIKFVENLL